MAFEKGEHPRLLVSANELEELRKRTKQGLRKKLVDRLHKFCNAYMNPNDRRYLDFREQKSEDWRIRSGIFNILPRLNALALGYAMTGNSEIGDFARDAMMAIIEDGLADVKSKAWGTKTEGWRHGAGHDKGKFSMTIALLYDFCYDRFTEEHRERFLDYAVETIKIGEESHDIDLAQIQNNRGVRGILGRTFLRLACAGDIQFDNPVLSEQRITQGLSAAETYLFLSYDSDGAPFEGPAYAVAYNAITFFAEALRRFGGPNLLANNRFERIPEYMLYELLPWGGSCNNLNDAIPGVGSIMGSIFLMGTARGELVSWLVRNLDLHQSRTTDLLETPIEQTGIVDGDRFLGLFLWWDDDAPIRTPQELGYPISHCFRERGISCMRSGWEEENLLLVHFCGKQQWKCHRQGDANHIALYALGEKFLVDAGYGIHPNDTTQPMNRWFGESDVHNCVMVDNHLQRGPHTTPGWTEGAILDFVHTPDYDTSLGDASACSGPDRRLNRCLRRVAFVREAPMPFIVVVDVVEKDGKLCQVDALWHTAHENRIETEEQGFVIYGQRNLCHGQVLYPTKIEISLADSYGRPQARASMKAAVVEMVTVFCPLRPDEAMPTFECKREGEGEFTVHCKSKIKSCSIRLSAATKRPMRTPLPMDYQAIFSDKLDS